jgi:hypothetical protein
MTNKSSSRVSLGGGLMNVLTRSASKAQALATETVHHTETVVTGGVSVGGVGGVGKKGKKKGIKRNSTEALANTTGGVGESSASIPVEDDPNFHPMQTRSKLKRTPVPPQRR